MIAPCLQTTGIENGVCQYSGFSSALVSTVVNMLFSTVPFTKNAKKPNFDHLHLFFDFILYCTVNLYSSLTSPTKWSHAFSFWSIKLLSHWPHIHATICIDIIITLTNDRSIVYRRYLYFFRLWQIMLKTAVNCRNCIF